MRSAAKTVVEYLGELGPDRREIVSRVRDAVNTSLPDGYEETMNLGMITWSVPLGRYPITYNSKPLMYAALVSQKNYVSLYLMGTYSSDARRKDFEKRLRETRSKAGLGKSCVAFKTLDDLPLDLVAETIASTSVDEFIADYELAKAQH